MRSRAGARDVSPKVMLIAVMLAAMAGCRDTSPATLGAKSDKGEGPRVVIIGAETADHREHALLEHAGQWLTRRILRSRVEVWPLPIASPKVQQELIERHGKEADILIVWPLDPESVQPVLAERAKEGVGVFLIGRDSRGSNRTAYSGPSEMDLGRGAAQACAAALSGRSPSVLLLHGGASTRGADDRLVGFMRELPLHGNIQIMQEVDCDGDSNAAAREVRRLSRLYPRTGAWVFLGDWALAAVHGDERLVPEGIAVVLCDATGRYTGEIRRGRVHAIAAYDVQDAIRGVLFSAAQWSNRKESVPIVDRYAPVEVVTGLNLEDYEARWKAWVGGQTSAELKP